MSTTLLLRQAETGSAIAILHLRDLSANQPGLFMRLLPILLRHFEVPIPRSGVDLWTEEQAQKAVPTLETLKACLEALPQGLENEYARVMPPVITNWSSLRDWLQFFVTKLLDNWGANHDLFDQTSHLCCSLMVCDPNPPVGSLPGLCRIILTLWMYNIRDRRFFSRFGSAVTRLSLGIGSADVRAEFFKFVERYPQVVHIVFSELHRTTERKAPDTYSLQIALFFLASTVLSKPFYEIQNRTCHIRFLEGGAIPAAVAAMSRLLRCDLSDTEQLGNILSITGSYLQYCFEHFGAWCVLQALETGWLEVMCKSVPLALQIRVDPRGSRSDNLVKAIGHLIEIYDILISHICAYVDHPQILRAARHWYRNSDQWDVFRHVQRSMPYSVGWRSLYASVDFNLQARKRHKHSLHRLCSNLKCSSTKLMMEDLKRCAGCLSAHYCSKTCQKEHWSIEHKLVCATPTGSYSLHKAPHIDQLFVKEMLYTKFAMLMRDTDSLNEIQSFYANYPVVVTVDDSCPEPQIQGGKRFLRNCGQYDAAAKALVTHGEYGRILFLGSFPDVHERPFTYIHWGSCGEIGPFDFA
ncbi:hypothetical protein C8J56DRAFT_946142 [Mycena floridula]|nr:hypothetical protein C8J56DRAFT_946142 [Mycena floridula]